MPAFLFNAPANGQQRIYLDESGTLGFGGEIFTMAMVLVRDLPKLEACTLRNRTTQSEVKASQMKTAQKLALARTLLEENEIDVYLIKLDPHAAMASERKLDKELLYDSMVAQALNFYLTRGDMARGLPYRISMDMRGGLRESYEDMVAESVGNVLMHRSDPLVTGLDVRFLDSKYSAGVQAADLFSNVYRTALAQPDSPCRSFLRKYQELGRVHAGFTFGLVELADQMAQIAADLRARVLLEGAVSVLDDGLSLGPDRAAEEKIIDVVEEILELGEETPAGVPSETRGVSRSARRRRSRATRRVHAAEQEAAVEQQPGATEQAADNATKSSSSGSAVPEPEPHGEHAAPATAGAQDTDAATPSATKADGEGELQTHAKPESKAEGGPKRRTRTRAKTAAKAQPASPDSLLPTVEADQGNEAAIETGHGAATEAEQPKLDVRPGRASRNRQAAQATSRRQRTAKKAATEQPAPVVATDVVPETPATAPSEFKEPAPQPVDPSPAAATTAPEAPAPETPAAPAPEAPAKKTTTRRRRHSPAKQDAPTPAGTSGENPKTPSSAEGGAPGKEPSPSTAESQGE